MKQMGARNAGHRRCSEAKSARCVRRGGGWRRGMAETPRPRPARQPPTLPGPGPGRRRSTRPGRGWGCNPPARLAPRSGSRLAVDLAPRHAFYDWCNEVLAEAEFDEAVEMLCQPHYKDGVGRPSIPPGRYFRMLFVGQFEGLDSEREIAWRCADSLSLHRFLRLSDGETVPDHSTLSVTRSRLPLEVHHAVFGFLLEIA